MQRSNDTSYAAINEDPVASLMVEAEVQVEAMVEAEVHHKES